MNSLEFKSEEHGKYCLLPIELIHPGRYQPRKHFNPEKLQELANTIAAHGVMQPMMVV